MTVSEAERLHEGLAPVGGTPSRTPAIEVDELVKRFDTLEAVRGISFDVAAGETFGFLGPNGAGKTTTIQVLCTLAHPTTWRRPSTATGDRRDHRRHRRRPRGSRVQGHRVDAVPR
jgi:ABC-type branched-subunit amino acid transport system ATPase component